MYFLNSTCTCKMSRKDGIFKLMCFETEKLFGFAMKAHYVNHKGII